MEANKKTQEKIQELQTIEQSLQSLLMQKQAFQMELSEAENALTEISKSDDDIFKMVGNIMIKSDKASTEAELKKKQELLSLRLNSIEKQEADLTKQSEEIRAEVMKNMR